MRVATMACALTALLLAGSVVTTTSMQDVPPGRVTAAAATEALTGFDGLTNGFVDQAEFDEAAEEFTGPETAADGLGPIFNGVGCGECHAVPVLGGSQQLTERRAGNTVNGVFTEHPGGSLIQDRALFPQLQERVLAGNNTLALRASLSVLGDGYVEAIDSNTLLAISNGQPSGQRGQLIQIPVREAPGNNRAGRFGWKNQHASLLSFAADAYKNEMGITSPLDLEENTFNGTPVNNVVPGSDPLAEPEDDGDDVELFATFMRGTKAPPVDAVKAATADAQAGSTLFNQIGCNVCHVRSITTAPAGTSINGGALLVHAALGDKIIHPFSDFLLHDVGTGDGIVQNGGQATRNRLRTPPLWALRTRGRFMHDGLTMSVDAAIRRHGGQATAIRQAFEGLSQANRNRILAFLDSL
jgi:CxxC motif-containing protein (DUF1111 family)